MLDILYRRLRACLEVLYVPVCTCTYLQCISRGFPSINGVCIVHALTLQETANLSSIYCYFQDIWTAYIPFADSIAQLPFHPDNHLHHQHLSDQRHDGSD